MSRDRAGVGSAAEPTDQLAMRRANLSRTLRYIRANGPRSRAAIAAATGLHKTTVSSLVDELSTRRLVRETDLEYSGSAGRPGRGVSLSPDVGAIGIEINVDYLAVHGTDLTGRTVIQKRVGYDATRGDVERCLADLTDVARRSLAELTRRGVTPIGLTVGIPGLVDAARGVVVLAPNLGWHDVPVAARLARTFGPKLWIGVDNDANLAALAEHAGGVAAGTDDLVYLTGEVGVGGGVILGGRLLRGADGFSGEIGHLLVDPGGDRCGCGRVGCWETKVGLAELLRRAGPGAADGPDRDSMPDPHHRIRQVARRIAAGDQAAVTALAEIGRWLGHGGAVLVNLFNPRVIVLGGYFAEFADRLIPAAQAGLAGLTVASTARRCHFVASHFGFTAAARGGAGVVLDRMIEDPTGFPLAESRPLAAV
ncbi:ROK family protein [Dactylosporangium cerinum]|uniref:ROK family protein n=1 Tax=Dactylosporangium cerinum TaxID=1434730 RepID=A0ABV9VRH0_9ACTN